MNLAKIKQEAKKLVSKLSGSRVDFDEVTLTEAEELLFAHTANVFEKLSECESVSVATSEGEDEIFESTEETAPREGGSSTPLPCMSENELVRQRISLQFLKIFELVCSFDDKALEDLHVPERLRDFFRYFREKKNLKYVNFCRRERVKEYNKSHDASRASYPVAAKLIDEASGTYRGTARILKRIIRDNKVKPGNLSGCKDFTGIIGGDELTLRNLRAVKLLFLRNIFNDNEKVAKKSAKLYRQCRGIDLRSGPLHFGFAVLDAVTRTVDRMGLPVLLSSLNRSDSITRETVLKSFEKSTKIYFQVFLARFVCGLEELYKNGLLPQESTLCDDSTILASVFDECIVKPLIEMDETDAESFNLFGPNLLRSLAIFFEYLDSIHHGDVEATACLMRSVLPLFVLAGKHRYSKLVLLQTDLDRLGSAVGLQEYVAFILKSYENGEIKCGIDEVVEFGVREIKSFKNFSRDSIKTLAQVLYLPTVLAKMLSSSSKSAMGTAEKKETRVGKLLTETSFRNIVRLANSFFRCGLINRNDHGIDATSSKHIEQAMQPESIRCEKHCIGRDKVVRLEHRSSGLFLIRDN